MDKFRTPERWRKQLLEQICFIKSINEMVFKNNAKEQTDEKDNKGSL